jgi:hypothetical protein
MSRPLWRQPIETAENQRAERDGRLTLRWRIRYDSHVRTLALVGSALLALSVVAGCSRPGVRMQSLADGTRELECQVPLWKCLQHVDDYCKGASYEVLYALDKQQVFGSQQSTIEARTSEAVIRCQGQHVKLTGPVDPPPAAAAPTSTPPVATTSKAPALACVPGATQACVGPGACSGGQACLADGSGFAACDCGATTPPTPQSAPQP